ncbi:UDP-N-acetylmuramoyl-tripeptide--D-alanyl-D-alanine ligase [Magnetococcales bacterium HHB-1]
MHVNLNFLQQISHGQLILPKNFKENQITDLTWTMEGMKPGALFIALENRVLGDGHQYIPQVLQQKAAALMVERLPEYPIDVPVLLVKNNIQSITQAAKAWRAQISPQVIAITGSVGKTSVKEMIAACARVIYGTRMHTGFPRDNNLRGIPLTLLRMDTTCELLVMEVGSGGPGDITQLLPLVQPDIGIITAIAPAHMENYQNEKEIAQEKSTLLHDLKSPGFAILPRHSPHFDHFKKRYPVPYHCFSPEQKNTSDTQTILLETLETKQHVRILFPNQRSIETTLDGIGQHVRLNASSAAATCFHLGWPLHTIAEGLANYKSVHNRGAIKKTRAGYQILDHSFNGNLSSMTSALAALAEHVPPKHRVAILGDLSSLGRHAPYYHQALIQTLIDHQIDRLFSCGPHMQSTHHGVRRHLPMAQYRPDVLDWIGDDHITRHLQPEDMVLVQGGGSMLMHRIVDDLLKTSGNLS